MFWKTYLQPIKFVSFLSSKESCKEKNTVFVQWIAQWWIISNKEPSCNQDALAKETSIIKISRLIEYNLIVWLDDRITQKKTFLFQIFSKVHKYNDFLFSLFSIFFLLHFFSIIFSPKILKFPYFVKPHIDLILSRRTWIDLVRQLSFCGEEFVYHFVELSIYGHIPWSRLPMTKSGSYTSLTKIETWLTSCYETRLEEKMEGEFH